MGRIASRGRWLALAALALWFTAGTAAAQSAAPAGPSTPWPGYTPKLFRSDEDYSALGKPGVDRSGILALKYIPLGSDDYLSLGGEYRLRFDRYQHPDFGLRGQGSFTSTQNRFLLHADLHLGPDVRAFVQLGDWTEDGRKPVPRPADHSRLDLAQGFVDIGWGAPAGRWRLRLGRQEVGLGRYVTIRDGTNIRRTFDGARLDGPAFGWTITALLARATRNRGGAFDDDADPKDGVALITGEHALPVKGFKLALIGLERDNDLARYLTAGREHRRSIGMRVYGGQSGWDADGQLSYQFGRFTPAAGAPQDIEAWGAAFEGGRTLKMAWSPRLAIRIDGAGGDRNPRDGKLATFDLPYPNLTYLTDAAIIAPRNVHDIQPFVTATPIAPVTLTAGVQFLWRNTKSDLVYSPINTPVVPVGGRGMYVATEPYLHLTWRIMPLVEFQAAATHAVPGQALKSVNGGKTLDFAFTSLAFRF